jgi:hypothetical protein
LRRRDPEHNAILVVDNFRLAKEIAQPPRAQGERVRENPRPRAGASVVISRVGPGNIHLTIGAVGERNWLWLAWHRGGS